MGIKDDLAFNRIKGRTSAFSELLSYVQRMKNMNYADIESEDYERGYKAACQHIITKIITGTRSDARSI